MWAMASAESFARGAVSILNAAGVVEYLSFGSESGDMEQLRRVAACLDGGSTPLGPDAAPLSRPNNTLGIEYLRALHALGSPIRPVTVKREGAGHNEAAVFAGDATREETNRLFWQHNPTLSATAIRCHLAEGDWKRIAPYLPPEGLALLRENMVEPGGLTRLERAILGLLTKWFYKKTVLKKVQEKAISAIKTTKTG